MDILTAIVILDELHDEVRCTCHSDYLKRGKHGPNCADYLVDDIDKLKEYIISLQRK